MCTEVERAWKQSLSLLVVVKQCIAMPQAVLLSVDLHVSDQLSYEHTHRHILLTYHGTDYVIRDGLSVVYPSLGWK